MDCDDATLLLTRDASSLTDEEAIALDEHVAGCETCFDLLRERGRGVGPSNFEVGETIAVGGMGRIFRAFDRRLGRDVALKEVLSPDLRPRFEREAMITARLQHPAIVPIYEAGTWPDGTAFYTMRLVPGETLTQAIDRRSTLPERLALLPHLIAVTEALAYAHSRGVIHRDLKPHNVLIGEFGETVVIDWGLAKEHGDSNDEPRISTPALPELTQVGSVVGTPCFMAPEQARGDDLDERADVFALGALLYNVLAGAPPYWDRSHDSKELIQAVLTRPPTPIAELAPAAPADLLSIVERAMERDPEKRYANAGEIAAELHRFAAGRLLLSRDYRIRDLLARWIRKHRALVALGSAALLGLAIVGVVAIRARREASTALEVGELRGQRTLCAASSPLLANPWTDQARSMTHHGFERFNLAYIPQTLERIDANLARWSAELETAKQMVCDAGDQPRANLAAELDCLADRTREARALIGQFHDVDKATVLNAIQATELLSPIASCTATIKVSAAVANTAERTAVRDLFARSHALGVIGKTRASLPISEEAVARADAIGDLDLRAAARVLLGSDQAELGDLEHAVPTLRMALQLAEANHEDRSAAQAWVNIIQIEYRRGNHEQVVFLQPAALGAAERLGDVFLETEMMMFFGGSLSQLGKAKEAEALFERAVTMRRKIYGDRDHRTANALSSLGNAYAMKGDLVPGIAAHKEAAEITEASLGNTHPNAGTTHGNLGSDYTYGLRAPEAIVEFQTAISIAEGAYGPKHRDVGMALTDLGTAQYVAGQYEAALATFDRAEALWRELNAKQPAMAEVLVGKYLANQALGKPANVADLETALDLAKQLPPFIRARIQLALGKAVTGKRGVELVTASAAGFATSTLPLSQKELADAKAWLAGHS